ncbi:hypothetical protein [Methylobacterium fujisawaense]|jgi:hypothetical protein
MSHPTRTPISPHARRRAQQRGKRRDALELVYRQGDRQRRAGRSRRAVSLSHRACRSLISDGVPPHLIDRARRIELIVSESDEAIVTVLTNTEDRK